MTRPDLARLASIGRHWKAVLCIGSILLVGAGGLVAAGVGHGGTTGIAQRLPGIQANLVAHAATGEVSMSNPVITPAGAVTFGDEVTFAVDALNSGPLDAIRVTDQTSGEPLAYLNDIGWPPDAAALDGTWTGRLDWGLVDTPRDVSELSFEYCENGRVISSLTAAGFRITDVVPRIGSFTVEPAGDVTIHDVLVVTAELDRTRLPGSVAVLIGEGREFALKDDGIAPDETARDGIYTAQFSVPVDLTYGTREGTRVIYRDSTGSLIADAIGPGLTLATPEVFLAGMTIDPEDRIELGQPLNIKVEFGPGSATAPVSLTLKNDELGLSFMGGRLDVYEYRDGRKEFTGVLEGDLEWSGQLYQGGPLSEGGKGFYVSASTAEGGTVSSTVESPRFEIILPDVEITGGEIAFEPPLEYGELAFVEAWTSKPVFTGSINLLIDGKVFSRLHDDGGSHIESNLTWGDDAAGDACWTGKLAWYYNPYRLEAGENLPARLQYVIGERVFAEYELDPITILPLDARIVSFYQEPSRPVRMGEDVNFVIDFNKSMNIGMLQLLLDDGTVLAMESDVSGARVELGLNWHALKEPGDYGPVTARYMTRIDEPVSELQGQSLVVID